MDFINHPVFRDMVYDNVWLWSHIILGGIVAKILLYFFRREKWRKLLTVVGVLTLGIVFEVFEYLFLTPVGIFDSGGDVAGAVIMALIVVW